MLTPGWHQVELDGVTQAYEVVGDGPVVFVHSGGPGIDSGEVMRMPLLERHLTMIYLDPVGTGKSGLLPGGDYSVAEYARRVELLRDHLDVADGFLLGHSHGGFVVLQYALDYPGRMRGLVVYDGASTNSSDLAEEASRQVAVFAARWPDRAEAVAAVHAREGGMSIHDVDSFREFMAATLPLYFADYRKTVKELGVPPVLEISKFDPARKGSEWDVRGKLGAIDAPTLVLVGTYDFICSPVWARQMHTEISNSRLVEFTDSGHLAHLEEPDNFFKSVYGFVTDVNHNQRPA